MFRFVLDMECILRCPSVVAVQYLSAMRNESSNRLRLIYLDPSYDGRSADGMQSWIGWCQRCGVAHVRFCELVWSQTAWTYRCMHLL